MNNRVTHLYAFIADGEDSICSMQIGNEHFPMLCAGRTKALEVMKLAAPHIAKAAGRPVRLVKFSAPEELEVFMPGSVQ